VLQAVEITFHSQSSNRTGFVDQRAVTGSKIPAPHEFRLRVRQNLNFFPRSISARCKPVGQELLVACSLRALRKQ
jgi:hypothetical protein